MTFCLQISVLFCFKILSYKEHAYILWVWDWWRRFCPSVCYCKAWFP